MRRNYAKSSSGFEIRIKSKVADLVFANYANFLYNRPLSHIKYAYDRLIVQPVIDYAY